MSPRAGGRIVDCDLAAAQVRIRQAESFLVVAELVLEQPEDQSLALTSVAAALAVLSGIASSDGACCTALGQRARGQDHQQAVDLLKTVRPEGDEMARDLRRLLAIKDKAQYGVLVVSRGDATSAAGWARRLLQAAKNVQG